MRILMWLAIGFAAGCGLCGYLISRSMLLPVLIGFAVLILAAYTLNKRWPVIIKGLPTLIGCALGVLWVLFFHVTYLDNALEADGKTMNLDLTARDYSTETKYGSAVSCTFTLDGKTYQVYAYLKDRTELEPGDEISGAFELRYTAPGGREDITYHAGKGIFLLAYQRGTVQIKNSSPGDDRWYPSEINRSIKQAISRIVPEDVYGFCIALLLGDSTQLDYASDTALKTSGIRHIIAVSGLHVSVLYSLIHNITLRRRFLTAAVGIPVLILFAAVAGFTPSVTRACIMVGLMMVSRVFNREYDAPNALSFASLVMLIANPMVIRSVSFQMSAGCVAGILLFQTPLGEWFGGKLGSMSGKGFAAVSKRSICSSLSVTIGAMSLTTPLSAIYFGAVSLVGVITNFLTLFVVNMVFSGLVICCAVYFLSVKWAAYLGKILAWLIRYVLAVAKLLAGFPLAAVYTRSVYITAWLIFVYLLLALHLIPGRKKSMLTIGCGICTLCLALLLSWAEPLGDDVRMTVLDVGQGQSILLQSEGRTYLVDCGGDSDTEAADMAAETLLSQGITRLDGIILTHGDADHAGGVENLLSRIQTDILVLPAATSSEIINRLAVRADGQVLLVDKELSVSFGQVNIQIFGSDISEESNENSLCVLFTRESCDILITGDRGAAGEAMLMNQVSLPQVDALIVGHHGSKYSTSEEFLQVTQPEVAIISVGANNPYGHPTQDVLDRLSRYGSRVYRTDEQGTIIFRR